MSCNKYKEISLKLAFEGDKEESLPLFTNDSIDSFFHHLDSCAECKEYYLLCLDTFAILGESGKEKITDDFETFLNKSSVINILLTFKSIKSLIKWVAEDKDARKDLVNVERLLALAKLCVDALEKQQQEKSKELGQLSQERDKAKEKFKQDFLQSKNNWLNELDKHLKSLANSLPLSQLYSMYLEGTKIVLAYNTSEGEIFEEPSKEVIVKFLAEVLNQINEKSAEASNLYKEKIKQSQKEQLLLEELLSNVQEIVHDYKKSVDIFVHNMWSESDDEEKDYWKSKGYDPTENIEDFIEIKEDLLAMMNDSTSQISYLIN